MWRKQPTGPPLRADADLVPKLLLHGRMTMVVPNKDRREPGRKNATHMREQGIRLRTAAARVDLMPSSPSPSKPRHATSS